MMLIKKWVEDVVRQKGTREESGRIREACLHILHSWDYGK